MIYVILLSKMIVINVHNDNSINFFKINCISFLKSIEFFQIKFNLLLIMSWFFLLSIKNES
jgi:hypothetical protein